MRTFDELLEQSKNTKTYYYLAERGGVWEALNDAFEPCLDTALTNEEGDEYFDKLIITLQEDAIGLTKLRKKVELLNALYELWTGGFGDDLYYNCKDDDTGFWEEFCEEDERLYKELKKLG